MAAINATLNGSPLVSGYGSLADAFSSSFLMPNLVRYGSWLIETQTPVVIAGAIALVVPARALWPGARRSEPLVMAALSATVWVSYCLYREFDAWWFLRFLLPSWPFLMAGTAAVLHALTSRRGPIVRAATTTPWDRPALVRAAP